MTLRLSDRHPLHRRGRGQGSRPLPAAGMPEQADGMSARQWDALEHVAALTAAAGQPASFVNLALHCDRHAPHKVRNTVLALARRGLLTLTGTGVQAGQIIDAPTAQLTVSALGRRALHAAAEQDARDREINAALAAGDPAEA